MADNIAEKLHHVRLEVIGITGCIISTYAALHSLKNALPPSTDRDNLVRLDQQLAELSKRLDDVIASFKNYPS